MSTHYKTLNFFDSLAEIVDAPIYIADSEDELQQELAANTWAISCNPKDADDLALNDFKLFFDEIIQNRRTQLENFDRQDSMWFCLWQDAQVDQLWFSLISELHSSLPFSAEVNVVASMDSIINDFIESIYHKAGMWPVQGTNDTATYSEQQAQTALDVYATKL
jgi:hypothetical protein